MSAVLMDAFEVIATALSIVVGLGMGHLLWTASAAFWSRKDGTLHWIPFAWALSVFLQHANFLISALAIDRGIAGRWTYSWYLQVLLQAVLLFVSGALVLPPESRRTQDLMRDFREHGRFALLSFAAYQALWFPTNYRANPALSENFLDSLLLGGNLLNIFIIGLLIVGFMAKSVRIQAVAASTCVAAVIVGMAFFWSQNVI